MKKVAIIGKPNVGKSSFYNRLASKLDAITSGVSGTTRDIKKSKIKLFNKMIELFDTGGIDDSSELFTIVKEKSIKTAREADIIIYMVDGRNIPDDEDKQLFYSLQKLNIPIALVINKLDNDKMEEVVWDYQSFGTEFIFPISVSHNRGITTVIEWIESYIEGDDLPSEDDDEQEDSSFDEYFHEDVLEDTEEEFELETVEGEMSEDFDQEIIIPDDRFDSDGNLIRDEEDLDHIKVAIIGRVNVGKSSLLNAITGEDRSVVSDVAGTTIDPVDEEIMLEDKRVTFVDTAGIRARGKIESIERWALMRTEAMLEVADVALLVLDGSSKIVELDEKNAGLVDKYGLATIIVVNKWDINEDDYKKTVEEIRRRFRFLYFAPIITVSAKTGRNIEKLKEMILKVYANYIKRISTSKVNEVILEAQKRHQIPSHLGKLIKIYYGTQFDIKPPKISVVMNRPNGLHFSYKRYLINFIRENFDYEGVPIRIITRKKKQRDELTEAFSKKNGFKS